MRNAKTMRAIDFDEVLLTMEDGKRYHVWFTLFESTAKVHEVG